VADAAKDQLDDYGVEDVNGNYDDILCETSNQGDGTLCSSGAYSHPVSTLGQQEPHKPAQKEEHMKISLPLSTPFLIYGTAWKKDSTANFVSEAIISGFRHIDTACQPKHYNELGVGNGIHDALSKLPLTREELYIQTKFTSVDGQDLNQALPFNKDAPISTQVTESVRTSLRNLRVDYIDGLVLHSPFREMTSTFLAWDAMERAVREGYVRQIGISNCYHLETFKRLYEHATIKPSVLQNRFYADSGFDTRLRSYCKEKGVQYQSFWTLTASRRALASSKARTMAENAGLESTQLLMYAYMINLGHTPLDGTTSRQHMQQDMKLVERIRGGDKIFQNDAELKVFGALLGIQEAII